MGWMINRTEKKCGKKTRVSNIVDLVKKHRDQNGWFLCECGKQGYIPQSFKNVEPEGGRFEPLLRGIICLNDPEEIYQPFAFLVSYEPNGPVTDVMFSYYKDLRSSGRRLKLGHGPGGPAVLRARSMVYVLKRLKAIGCVSARDLRAIRG